MGKGFSLLMFGGTIWQLVARRSTQKVNRKMLTAACLLLLCSTVVRIPFQFLSMSNDRRLSPLVIQHLIIDIIRIIEGLILYRDTYPGGPTSFFASVSQWTFVSKNYLYTVQSLIGDGVMVSFIFVKMNVIC